MTQVWDRNCGSKKKGRERGREGGVGCPRRAGSTAGPKADGGAGLSRREGRGDRVPEGLQKE